MKTSKFIKRVEELGYSVLDDGYRIRVRRSSAPTAKVLKNEVNKLDTILYKGVPDELFDILFEYAKTPIEERESEKEYYLRLPIKSEPVSSYLNYEKNKGDFSFMSKSEAFYWKTKFTQEEIDNLPNQDFIKTLIKEEVECQS